MFYDHAACLIHIMESTLLPSPRGTCLAEGVVDGRWEGDSGGMREPFSTVTAFWPLMMEFELDAGIGVAHA